MIVETRLTLAIGERTYELVKHDQLCRPFRYAVRPIAGAAWHQVTRVGGVNRCDCGDARCEPLAALVRLQLLPPDRDRARRRRLRRRLAALSGAPTTPSEFARELAEGGVN